MTGEDERTCDGRFSTDVLGQRRLADAGLTAQDNEAATAGKRGPELRLREASFARASDEEWAWRQLLGAGGAKHMSAPCGLRLPNFMRSRNGARSIYPPRA